MTEEEYFNWRFDYWMCQGLGEEEATEAADTDTEIAVRVGKIKKDKD